jgi:hypothetical protein
MHLDRAASDRSRQWRLLMTELMGVRVRTSMEMNTVRGKEAAPEVTGLESKLVAAYRGA